LYKCAQVNLSDQLSLLYLRCLW